MVLGAIIFLAFLISWRSWARQAFGRGNESRKGSTLRWWQRPSTLLMLLVAGFFAYRGLQDPRYFYGFASHSGPHRRDWYASEVAFFLAFGIRYWENQTLRDDDDSDEDGEKSEDSPDENGKFG